VIAQNNVYRHFRYNHSHMPLKQPSSHLTGWRIRVE